MYDASSASSGDIVCEHNPDNPEFVTPLWEFFAHPISMVQPINSVRNTRLPWSRRTRAP